MERATCLRCGGKTLQMGQVKFQMGQYGFFLGALNHPISGALPADLSCCSDCKKLEFCAVEQPEEAPGIAREPCPHCGEPHEIDDPKCPHGGKQRMD